MKSAHKRPLLKEVGFYALIVYFALVGIVVALNLDRGFISNFATSIQQSGAASLHLYISLTAYLSMSIFFVWASSKGKTLQAYHFIFWLTLIMGAIRYALMLAKWYVPVLSPITLSGLLWGVMPAYITWLLVSTIIKDAFACGLIAALSTPLWMLAPIMMWKAIRSIMLTKEGMMEGGEKGRSKWHAQEGELMSEVGEVITIHDDRCELRKTLAINKYPPGNYILACAIAANAPCYRVVGKVCNYIVTGQVTEQAIEVYFSKHKKRWLSIFTYDYALACLRRDEEVKKKLKEVYGRLAEKLGWSDEMKFEFEGDLRAAAEEAVKKLFELYKFELMVDGWRDNPQQSPADKEELLHTRGSIGNLYRLEYGSWRYLLDSLFSLAQDVRKSDRVAYWMSMRLIEEVSKYLYGEKRALKWGNYMDHVLDGIASNAPIDECDDGSAWWICFALKELRKYMNEGELLIIDVAEPVALAGMVLEDYEADPLKVKEYLVDLTNRLKLKTIKGMPDLIELYATAKGGPRDKHKLFWEAIFKDWKEMTDEEKDFFKEMKIANLTFARYMCAIIGFLREKYGYKELSVIEDLRDLAEECVEKLKALR